MTSNIPLLFRSRNADDRNFIVSSWMRSFRSGSKWAKDVSAEVYKVQHQRVIMQLLANSGSIVACSPDDPNQIFGYAIYQPSAEGIAIIHWLYVKEMYRKLGIGASIYREVLMAADHDLKMPCAVTHSTHALDWAADKYNLVHNPYLAFEVTEHGEIESDRVC